MYDDVAIAARVPRIQADGLPMPGAHREWTELRERGALLDSKQMAHFVANGFVRLDALAPDALNREFCAAIKAGTVPAGGGYGGASLVGAFAETQPIGKLLALPRVRGLIASLVGPEPVYDHHAVHVVPERRLEAQNWHADATIDTRRHFDIQLMYFPQDTTREMGGTLILPGSHFRIIHEMEASRYQNFRGQLHTVCPAGTLIAVHHNLWHCAQPNRTDTVRYMFKLRLNPTYKQERLWDTRDLDDPEVSRILMHGQPWMDTEVRLEFVQRIKLWRRLTGDAGFDAQHWLGRLENDPQRSATG